MNTKTRIALAAATLGLASAGYAGNSVEFLEGLLSQTNHTLIPMLDWRARYEYGDQDGLEEGHAATLRARVGLQSQDYSGFSGLVEFEATRAIDSTSYRAANVDGDPAKTVIADPESTELNRAQLQFKKDGNLVIGGRQRIILDNARFIGNVGWRQNEQTYDAVSYKNTMVKDLALYYAYLSRVNRIFGSEAPIGSPTDDFDSESSLFNVAYTGFKNQKLAGYAYLLDFDNSAANSSDTIGLSYSVKGTVAEDYTLDGYIEYARQQDAGDNPTDYTADYVHVNGKVARKGYFALVGYELLGSDDGTFGFRTPLATAHAFNGWNDQFLTTPAAGLQDFYVGIGLPVPKVPVKIFFHNFTSDEGSVDYGQELDIVAAHKITPKLKAVAKASYYDADEFSVDRTRFSVQLDYKY